MLNLLARKLGRYSFAILWVVSAAIFASAQSRPPVILIPGLTGSELINSKTGEKVWFKLRRSKGDDLRLPISLNIADNRDSLIAGDIIRDIKAGLLPRADIYGGFIASLVAKGYREGRWDAPPARGYENTLYIFSYDWRRDNVENARLLMRKIAALKRAIRRPMLKFDVIGHSMGGLIARYAMMYGDSDLPVSGPPKPNWSGAQSISKVIIMGTPNEGSPLSLRDMINGFALLGIEVNLPFIQSLTKFDVFTIPAAYELLPAPGTLKAFDQDLNPLNFDIYDPATWQKYGWSVSSDKNFAKELSPGEQKIADRFFATWLDRGKRFHEALDVSSTGSPVPVHMIGSDCKDTLDALVLYQKKDGSWDSVFKADSFETPSGGKITSEALKAKIYVPGDGIVTKRSFTAATVSTAAGVESVLAPASSTWICEGHSKLPSNPEVQAKVFSILSAAK